MQKKLGKCICIVTFCFFIFVQSVFSADNDVDYNSTRTQINQLQATDPNLPTGVSQPKGIIGDILAKMFGSDGKIGTRYLSIFSVGSSTINPSFINGATITGINASNIGTGTLSDARLSSNIVFTTGNQSIGGIKTFTGGTIFSGNIGIGTTTPTTALEVNGSIYINNTTPGLLFRDVDTNASSYLTASSFSGSIAIVADSTNVSLGSQIIFGVDSTTPKMVLNGSGNVGIGTTTPTQRLDVSGNINMSGDLYRNGVLFSSGKFVDGTNTSNAVYTGGNVGIGKQPTQALDVSGNILASGPITSNNTTPEFKLEESDRMGIGRGLWRIKLENDTFKVTSSDYYAMNSWGNEMTNLELRSDQMQVFGSIRAGFGNSEKIEGSYIFGRNNTSNATTGSINSNFVIGDANAINIPVVTGNYGGGNRVFGNNNIITGQGRTVIGFGNTSTSTANSSITIGNFLTNSIADSIMIGNGSGSLTVLNNGNIGIGTSTPTQKLDVAGTVRATAFLYSSDKRLKTNIQNYTDAKSVIDGITTVRYDWKDSSKGSDIGVIAQDVQKVFPEAVRVGSDGYLAVDYSKLIVPTIQLVKDQQTQIESLQNQIKALEEAVNNLGK